MNVRVPGTGEDPRDPPARRGRPAAGFPGLAFERLDRPTLSREINVIGGEC